jgi:uncharacterized protein YgbK (DUF1537 family)
MLFLARGASLLGGPMRVGIIADDLTGAADTGVQLARTQHRRPFSLRLPAREAEQIAVGDVQVSG